MQKNKVELSGYVANYKEYKTKNDKTISSFGLSIYNGKNKEGKPQYEFVNIKAFKELNLVDREYIELIGHLAFEKWKDKRGNEQKSTIVFADNVNIMASPNKPSENKEDEFIDDSVPF